MNELNNFENLSNELIQKILFLASEGKAGPLLEQRRVCKLFYHNVNAFIEHRYNVIKKSFCEDENKNSLTNKIFTKTNNAKCSQVYLFTFQNFAKKFNTSLNNVPINKADLLELEATSLSLPNLKIIWKTGGVQGILSETYTGQKLPEEDAEPTDIFNFLEKLDPNTEILNTGIYQLEFSNLNLTSFPSIILKCFPKATMLLLSDNMIERLLPLNSNTLKFIVLSQNKLTEIPDLNCPNLEYLNLVDNQIKRIDYPQKCIKLKTLLLNNNQIKKFMLYSPSLQVLELRGNPVHQIQSLNCPQLIGFSVSKKQELIQVNELHCPQLHYKNLQLLNVNHLEFEERYNLSQSKSNTALETICSRRLCQLVFHLYDIQFEEPPTEDLQLILNTLSEDGYSSMEKVETLDLSNLNLEVFPLQLLQHLPNLTELDLSGNPIENLKDLQNYPNLTVLFDNQN